MRNNNFKTLLVFPPVWLPETPFLSTPLLTSYLKEHGVCVLQKDVNVEFWNNFYHENVIETIYKNLKKKWEELYYKDSLSEYETFLQVRIAAVIGLSLKRFVKEVKKEIISKEFYRTFIHGVSEFNIEKYILKKKNTNLDDIVGNYHDSNFSEISYSMFAQSTKDLINVINNKEKNPFVRYYKENTIDSIKEIKPHLIGISIVAINQVIPAFILAKVIKDNLPGTHIVIGGSWCTQVHEKLSPKLKFFDFIDSMAIYEGEDTLMTLCSVLQGKSTWDKIPNLYYKHNGTIKKNDFYISIDMDTLPTPNFERFPLHLYDDTETFPLQASRGCYWGKCSFCTYSTLEPCYKTRSVEKVVEDIKLLKSKYKIKTISFTDAVISPSFAKIFSEVLLNEKISIEWIMYARFECAFKQDLLNLMAISGCSRVNWGLESGNERILKVIRKGINLKKAEEILKDSANAGIHNRVLVMYGHPTETKNEAYQTIDFIQKNQKNIHSISYSFYQPEINSPIEDIIDELDINFSFDTQNDLSLGYKWSSNLEKDDKIKIMNNYMSLSNKLCMDLENNIYNNHSELIKLLSLQNTNSFLIKIFSKRQKTKNIFSTIINRDSKVIRKCFEVLTF